MDFFFLPVVGIVMLFVGYKGLQVYARSFFDDPSATISADILLALLRGAGAVPAVMCVMVMLGGIYLITLTLFALIAIVYHLISTI